MKVTTFPETKAARITVLRQFLSAGDPLSSIDTYRLEFEKFHSQPMVGSSHMAKLLPVLDKMVTQELREFYKGKKVFLIFDGATFDGDVLVLILRTVNDWKIFQKIVQVRHADSTLNNKELNAFIIQTLCQDMALQAENFLGCLRLC